MKYIVILLILMLGGCMNKESKQVTSITDDIPEINIPNTNLDPNDYFDYSNKKVAWGLGPSKNELAQPMDSVTATQTYQNLNTYFLYSNDQEILLTFDNGYENGNTVAILDTLKQHDVHAIFFITSQYAIENADLVERMIEEGHVIGNHSWHHRSFPELTTEVLIEEIMSLHEYMLQHFNYNMTTLRPPKGEFSERTLAITKDLGYETYMWSMAYYDFNVNDQPDESTALNKLVNNLHPGEILLLHAVSDTNMKILDDFITQAKEKGYTFVNVSN